MRLALALPLLLAACGLPRDTEGTSERLAAGTVRVGRVLDGRIYYEEPTWLLLSALQTRGSVEGDAAEPLLSKLERGDLDVVLGRFTDGSPWETRVTFAERTFHGFRIATRNGEHRWAMTVDRALRDARR